MLELNVYRISTDPSGSPTICRAAKTDGTKIENAQCHKGICKCNTDYYANEDDSKDPYKYL